MKSVQAKELGGVIGRTEKFFDINSKDVRMKQGPSTYRPSYG